MSTQNQSPTPKTSPHEVLRYLSTAAASFAALAVAPQHAIAQSVPEEASARIKFVYYNDSQGSGDRMTVRSPMLLINAPLNEAWEVEAGLILDTVSGASPFYLDTLTGASGKGIDDDRVAADVKFTRHFEDFSLGLGVGYSDEDDYTSRTGSIDARFWNDDKSTVYAVGLSRDWDQISSTNNEELDESRQTMHYMVGVTQIINAASLVQSNITYAAGEGYYIDPYKLFDRRPRSREEWAWLTRYVLHLKDWGASLHTDYRLYFSSWDVGSHMVDVKLYQPVSETLTIRPGIRYYMQDEARFYNETVPPESFEGANSSDQRLGKFGSITAGLKTIWKIDASLEFDLSYEYILQDKSLHLRGGSDDVEALRAHYVEVGFHKKF